MTIERIRDLLPNLPAWCLQMMEEHERQRETGEVWDGSFCLGRHRFSLFLRKRLTYGFGFHRSSPFSWSVAFGVGTLQCFRTGSPFCLGPLSVTRDTSGAHPIWHVSLWRRTLTCAFVWNPQLQLCGVYPLDDGSSALCFGRFAIHYLFGRRQ